MQGYNEKDIVDVKESVSSWLTQMANVQPMTMDTGIDWTFTYDYKATPEIAAAPIRTQVLKSRPKGISKFRFNPELMAACEFSKAESEPDPHMDKFYAELEIYKEKRAKTVGRLALKKLDEQWEDYVVEHFPSCQSVVYDFDEPDCGPNDGYVNGDTIVAITACGHERKMFDLKERTKVVTMLMRRLKPHVDDFDALAISGYSMTMIAPIIAPLLDPLRFIGPACIGHAPHQRSVPVNVQLCGPGS